MATALTEQRCFRACGPCVAHRLNIGLMLVFCLLGRGLHAEESLQPLSGYVHRAWTTRIGAPGDISDITQTADGMIWIASASGLFKFDGVRFVEFHGKPGGALSLDSVWSLYAPPTGGLWVGLHFGGLVFSRRAKSPSTHPTMCFRIAQ